MGSERRRRAVFAALLSLAILGAVAVMASVLVDDLTWRVVAQVVGLVTSSAASLAVVLTVRRWGVADDFWWPASAPPAEVPIDDDAARAPGPRADR